MTEIEEQLEEQNKMLKLISKLLIDQNLKKKTESEKAQYLADSGFNNREIADLLNKDESTISRQVD